MSDDCQWVFTLPKINGIAEAEFPKLRRSVTSTVIANKIVSRIIRYLWQSMSDFKLTIVHSETTNLFFRWPLTQYQNFLKDHFCE